MKILCMTVAMLLASVQCIAGWNLAYQGTSNVYCLVEDSSHERLFAGTTEGFVYFDHEENTWVSVEDQGSIQLTRAILHDSGDPLRLLIAGEDEARNGWIKLTLDLGVTNQVVYSEENLGPVWDIKRDPTNPSQLFACSATYATNSGRILRSTNNGVSWETVEESDGNSWFAIAITSEGIVLVVGDNGVLKSEDDGNTWSSGQGDLPQAPAKCIASLPISGHILAGTHNDLYESIDTGDHWQPILWQYSCRNVDYHANNPGILAAEIEMAGGPAEFILISFNGGVDWIYSFYYHVAYDYGACKDIDIFTANNHIYATNFYDIYEYPLDLTSTPDAGREECSLMSYPNPMNPMTILQFNLAEQSQVDLRIFDSSGRVVRNLIYSEHLPAGIHSRSWDGYDDSGRDCPSGVYICRLKAGIMELVCKALIVR